MRLALAALALFWLTGAWGAEVRLEELPSEAQATLALIKHYYSADHYRSFRRIKY